MYLREELQSLWTRREYLQALGGIPPGCLPGQLEQGGGAGFRVQPARSNLAAGKAIPAKWWFPVEIHSRLSK